MHFDATLDRVVRIRFGQQRRPAAERAVDEQFHRPEVKARSLVERIVLKHTVDDLFMDEQMCVKWDVTEHVFIRLNRLERVTVIE